MSYSELREQSSGLHYRSMTAAQLSAWLSFYLERQKLTYWGSDVYQKIETQKVFITECLDRIQRGES